MARYPDVRQGGTQRVEHWQVARDQGAHAAKNMLGAHEPYRDAPYFFSDVFELSWEYWGNPAKAEAAWHVGDLEHGTFSVWWVRDGKVAAGFSMGRVMA